MSISVEKAIQIISDLRPILNSEILAIENATSRICAQNIFATSFYQNLIIQQWMVMQ